MSAPILMAVAALLAQAAQPAASSDTAVVQAAVSELVVRLQPKCFPAKSAPTPAPKITSTFPTEGQVVRPGLLVIRISFDRPMTCGGFLQALAGLPNPCPPRTQTFIQSFDHKTIRTLCLTHPGQAYGVVVGDPSEAFVSLDGRQALPVTLRFSTSGETAQTSLQGALDEDAGGRWSVPKIREPVKRRADPSFTTSAPGVGQDLRDIRPEQP
jgi:hypothetical protein